MKKLLERIGKRIPLNTESPSVWRINIKSDWSRGVLFILSLLALSFFFISVLLAPVKDVALTPTNAALILAFPFAIALIVYSLLVYFPAVLIRTIFKKELRRRVEEARKRRAEEDFVHLHIRPISRGDRLSKKATKAAISFAVDNGIFTEEEVRKHIDMAVSTGIATRDARNREIVFVGDAKKAMLEMVKEARNRKVTVPTFRISITNRIVHRVEPVAEIKKTDRAFTFGWGPTKFKIVVDKRLLEKARKIYMFERYIVGGILPVTERPVV